MPGSVAEAENVEDVDSEELVADDAVIVGATFVMVTVDSVNALPPSSSEAVQRTV